MKRFWANIWLAGTSLCIFMYTAISDNVVGIKAERQDWKAVWVEEESNCTCWILKYIVTWQMRICPFSFFSDMWNKVLLTTLNLRRIFKTQSQATLKVKQQKGLLRGKNKLVNSSRAKYKFVHLMKLICKFIVNTQNAIRSCLLALIFDPTTLIEIAVYWDKVGIKHYEQVENKIDFLRQKFIRLPFTLPCTTTDKFPTFLASLDSTTSTLQP